MAKFRCFASRDNILPFKSEDSYALKKVVGESRRLTFKQAAQTLRIWVAMVSESQDEFLGMLDTLAPVLSWYEKLGEDYTITFSF